jgi:hypothetical protein
MLRECPLKPFARRRWIDQGVEEYRPVPVRQDERLVLRNRPPGGVRECRHAEIRHLAPFELRRPFDQSLGRLIYPKPKPRFPKPSVGLCCRGHGHLRPHMYVSLTNFSMGLDDEPPYPPVVGS